MLSKILLRQHDNDTLFVVTTRQCPDNGHKVENDTPDHFYCIFNETISPKFEILSYQFPTSKIQSQDLKYPQQFGDNCNFKMQ